MKPLKYKTKNEFLRNIFKLKILSIVEKNSKTINQHTTLFLNMKQKVEKVFVNNNIKQHF